MYKKEGLVNDCKFFKMFYRNFGKKDDFYDVLIIDNSSFRKFLLILYL